jgi:hypothetical protein
MVAIGVDMKKKEMKDKENIKKKKIEYKEKGINELAERLDKKSRNILVFLYRNRYANIQELSDLIEAKNHNEVLSRLKEVINPTSMKILGRPLVKFEKAKIDPLSGEKILFSWWLTENIPLIRKEGIDLFNEGDSLVILADLGSIKLSKPLRILKKSYKNGILEIVLKKEKKDVYTRC